MPRKKSQPNATLEPSDESVKRPSKSDISSLLCPPQQPVPLTDAMKTRFAELHAEPRPEDSSCLLCHFGKGIEKVRLGIQLVCVPCAKTLLSHPYSTDRMTWQQRRMPAFIWYVTHPNRATLHIPQQQVA